MLLQGMMTNRKQNTHTKLSQNLFQRDKSTISRHIKNVFKEGELARNSTVAEFATVQMEGSRQAEKEIPMTMQDWAEH